MATSSGSKSKSSKKRKKTPSKRNKSSARTRKVSTNCISDDITTAPVVEHAAVNKPERGRRARLDQPSYPVPLDNAGKPVNVNPGVSPSVLKMIVSMESPAERAKRNVEDFYAKNPVSKYVRYYDFLTQEFDDSGGD